MKVPVIGTALGAVAVAGGAAAIVLTTGGASAAIPTKVSLASASSPGAAAADQAALSYVDQRFTGAGAAAVLKTEADTEHGVPVYDVLVKAPNGTIYSLSIRTSNDSVLVAHPAESQGAPAATTPGSSSPDTHTPAATSSKDAPEAQQTPEPRQTPEPDSISQSNANISVVDVAAVALVIALKGRRTTHRAP